MVRHLQDVRAILRSTRRKVFLVGAGISKTPPTGYPLALELVTGLLKCISEGRPWIIPHVKLIENAVNRGISGCRLEVLLEIARQQVGNEVLRLLSFFENGVPNIFHYLLAYQLHNGHVVLTTNFDTMIELAYTKLFGTKKRFIVLVYNEEFSNVANDFSARRGILAKLHGSVRDGEGNPSYDSMQATLASMANGLSQDKSEFLVKLLRLYDFVVLGYSGCDDFDFNKVWMTVRPNGRFVWVKHASCNLTVHPIKELPSYIPGSDPVRKLLSSTENSYLIEGITSSFLPYISDYTTAVKAVTWPTGHVTSWLDQLKAEFRASFNITDTDCRRFSAKVLEYNGELLAARTCLEQGIVRASGLERATLLDDLGQCCLQLRSFDESLSYRNAARRVAYRCKESTKDVIIARTWLGVAECLRHTANYSKSLSAFRKAKDLFHRLGMRDRIGYCLAGSAGIYRMTSRYSKASAEYEAAVREFSFGKDLHGQLYAYWGLGEVCKYTGRLIDAKSVYESVRSQAEKLGHQRLIALAIWGNAEILRLSWQISDAIKAYDEAYTAFPSSDLAGRSWALEGMAQCLLLSGDSPIPVLQAAESGFTQLGAAIGIATTKIDRALFEITCGRIENAEQELSQIDLQRLPRKDKLNYQLVLAEMIAHTDTVGARNIFAKTYYGYKRLGMVLQAIGTGILLLDRCVSTNSSKLLTRLEILSMLYDYKYEHDAIQAIKARSAIKYNANLC